MIQETSIKALAQHEQRQYQNEKVLRAIMSAPHNLTALDLYNITGFMPGTIHARINDLKKGYRLNGVMWWVIEHGKTKQGNRERIMWGVTSVQPPQMSELAKIEAQLRKLFAKRRAIKQAELRSKETLFLNQ